MRITCFFFLSIGLAHCSFFPPQKLSDLHILVLEKEMPGYFKGKKFFFNRFNEFMGFSNAEKECELKTDISIQCNERFILRNHQINRLYCYYFNYDQTNEIFINYIPKCKQTKKFFSTFFKNFNKVRGGGFLAISYDFEPLNQMTLPIKYYFIRSSTDYKLYFEEKYYYLLFWGIGKEITIWEKIY